MLEALKELISIKSVLSRPEDGAPFGKGCAAALDWFLKKADSFGFKTHNLDGYCGWAEYGEGSEMVGVLCHLDVVPAEGEWKGDPFTLRIENDQLYGRGVADDKGAAIMCLYALKEIKDSGLKLGKRIRIIVGINEEHGSQCMKYYVKHAEMPSLSIVPDADFPIINSEKGILHLKMEVPVDSFFEQNIAMIRGGGSINVVPDLAEISIFKDSPLAAYINKINGGAANNSLFSRPELVGGILAAGYKIEDFYIKNEEKYITICAKGVAGHAMSAHLADNAIWKLFNILTGLSRYESPLTEAMCNYICTPQASKNLGIFKEDPESGDTTVSMGMIEVGDEYLTFTLDIRLCLSSNAEDVKKCVLAALPPKSRLTVLKNSPNLYVDKDHFLIKTLLEVYTSVTGKEGECLHCGGGTYARELKNAVAFGPVFPGVLTNLHNVNESLPISDFYKAALIYKQAMIKLAK